MSQNTKSVKQSGKAYYGSFILCCLALFSTMSVVSYAIPAVATGEDLPEVAAVDGAVQHLLSVIIGAYRKYAVTIAGMVSGGWALNAFIKEGVQQWKPILLTAGGGGATMWAVGVVAIRCMGM